MLTEGGDIAEDVEGSGEGLGGRQDFSTERMGGEHVQCHVYGMQESEFRSLGWDGELRIAVVCLSPS